ncbi:MAG: putative addiction module antidote protein [Verrucomicrobiota bacterium]
MKDHLAGAEQAAKCLTACYEEGPEVFLQGLRDGVEAQGGMTRAARLAGLNRERLYRQLSRRGNPSLAGLNAVLTALGLRLRFAAG